MKTRSARNSNLGVREFPQLRTAQSLEAYDVSSSTICVGLKGLSQGQGKLCQLSVDHMPSVAIGAKYAVRECQHQFKHRRWNCSIVEDESVFGPIIRTGIFGRFRGRRGRTGNSSENQSA